VQNAIIGEDNSVTGGLIGALALLIVNYLVVRFLFRHRRLDQMIEGSPATLIQHGQLDQRALAREMLTESELLTVAHRQGFCDLDEVEQCVLEPGGVFFMQGKKPPLEERQHTELITRLDELARQMAEVREQISRQ
jgi:uncharacterized membrane protein YcaP (DUF421 family)